jgi:tyrosyl-tRNA synthetase
MGRQLMERASMDKQVVMVMPLLVGLDGHEKMSKSKDNYIAVKDEPNDMFGKVMSIPDTLMGNYYELLTAIPPERIASLLDTQQTHPRDAKDILGRSIVEEFHDRDAANSASAEFRNRFAEGALPSDIETKTVDQSPIGIVALVAACGFASSNSEARRLVQQGAVSYNDAKITDPKTDVTIEGDSILKVGKRRVCKVACSPA